MDGHRLARTKIDTMRWDCEPNERAMESWRILWDKLLTGIVEHESEVPVPSDGRGTRGLENRDLVGDT
jgi:hypothetical protein